MLIMFTHHDPKATCTFIQYIILGYNGTFYFHFLIILAMDMRTSTIRLTSNNILLYCFYNKHATLSQWTTTRTRSWICFVEFLVGVHTKPCWLSCVCWKDIGGKSSLFPSFGDILELWILFIARASKIWL